MERRIFAHRGLNRVAPENSLAAFEKTADAGLTWIETDVDILGDGTPIVIHDTSQRVVLRPREGRSGID